MRARNQGVRDEQIEAAWAGLVSRATRVALARQDLSYAELASRLSALGLTESARSVEGKVQRGRFRFSFFLQAVYASGATYPLSWAPVMSSTASWPERATSLLHAELGAQPWLDWPKVARRLEEIGIWIDADDLETQVGEGTFSTTLFFQCATVCRFDGVQLYLDSSYVNAIARDGASAS
ncbi:DUF6471 domain-containing protein [Caballeronia calidae]|uniref:DUF6471 domain-containing protein n=1 Tax=Caballeronia calidae TaxID=1777139 RepID=UPI00078862C9|nr:DUF6471 domain-containing protein [Caballeronia calidae]